MVAFITLFYASSTLKTMLKFYVRGDGHMRKVGKDYVFKILNQEFFESVFKLRRRYFLKGEPSELGEDNTAYFVMKKEVKYFLVGEGVCVRGLKVHPADEAYEFARKHGWDYAIQLDKLIEYQQPIPVDEIFSESIVREINSQRPFGIPLPREEAKKVKEKLRSLGLKS